MCVFYLEMIEMIICYDKMIEMCVFRGKMMGCVSFVVKWLRWLIVCYDKMTDIFVFCRKMVEMYVFKLKSVSASVEVYYSCDLFQHLTFDGHLACKHSEVELP